MLQHDGWWFPDGEVRVLRCLSAPRFNGRLTYQHRKYLTAHKFVRQFRHAVDVGAHVGLWSRTMASHFERVTAFEPLPLHRDCFVKNLEPEALERVTLMPFAVGHKQDQVEFSSKVANSGVAHVRIPSDHWQMVVPAEMRTLDSFELTDVDFLKIDTEGFDCYVVQGAEATIRRWRPVIVVEQKPKNAERYGAKQHDAVELLKAWGATVNTVIAGDHVVVWP